ncbi:hypothetical protein ACFKHW_38115 [Bradyrhizobium lupini]|uniref:hypothetical protein n=1 Tax=Rhizobium lupini TaxID=136996 RepID=UPI00366AF23B
MPPWIEREASRATEPRDQAVSALRARTQSVQRLSEFGKAWCDLIKLLGDEAAAIDAELARNIAALGASDPDVYGEARRNIADLLARHHKNWNDLTDALCARSSPLWASGPHKADDPPRVNPLALVLHLLEEYVALQPHHYVAVALWVLHTHVYGTFQVTPRLTLRSPTADAGKTTLLDILARLTARPAKFEAITTAALYRLIDETHPTLLIDEADNLGLALQPNGRCGRCSTLATALAGQSRSRSAALCASSRRLRR